MQELKKTKFWKNFSSNHLPMGRLARIDEVLPVIDLLASEKCIILFWSNLEYGWYAKIIMSNFIYTDGFQKFKVEKN